MQSPVHLRKTVQPVEKLSLEPWIVISIQACCPENSAKSLKLDTNEYFLKPISADLAWFCFNTAVAWISWKLSAALKQQFFYIFTKAVEI